MNLVDDHVPELNHIHHPDSSLLLEWFAGSPVIKLELTAPIVAGSLQLISNFVIRNTSESLSGHLVAQLASRHADMHLKELSQVHTRRHTHRI